MLRILLPFEIRCLSLSTTVVQETNFGPTKNAEEQSTESSSSKGLFNRIMTGDGVSRSHSTLLADQKDVYEIAKHRMQPGQSRNYWKYYEVFVSECQKIVPDLEHFGSFTTIYGQQDLAVHLWRYKNGYDTVDKFVESLSLSQILQSLDFDLSKLCNKRSNALCKSFSYWGDPQPRTGKHIYDLRTYVLKPGHMIEWGNNWAKVIAMRRDYGQDVAGLFSQTGPLYTVYHLWAYESMEARRKIREQTWQKPGWDTSVSFTVPLITKMNSMIMLPTPFSPTK